MAKRTETGWAISYNNEGELYTGWWQTRAMAEQAHSADFIMEPNPTILRCRREWKRRYANGDRAVKIKITWDAA